MDKYTNKRESIKHAGIKSFAAYGYYKTTLEDIAEILGMKKNSLYYYFESKDALFEAIIKEELNKHLEKQAAIASQNISASKKLINIIELLLLHIKEDSTKYAIKVKSFLEIGKVIKKSFPEFHKNKREILEKILQEGISSGEFKPHNITTFAEDINLLIDGVIYTCYWDSDAEFVNEIDFNNISKKISRIVNYMISGIIQN